MSMPERIWRVVRGRWLIAEERRLESMAEAEASRELEESRYALPANGPSARPVTPSPRHPITPSSRPTLDPLAADLALLGAPPACNMETLDRLYAERLAELQPEALPVDSPERAPLTARRAALAAAYERLRDAINTTETRFEKLEF
jgi:hypothetical protein